MTVVEDDFLFTEARAAEIKARWGPGPWATEPDRVQWWAHGLPCLALRAPLGSWNGYVGLRPGHPWYGQPYATLPGDVDRGLSYSGPTNDAIRWHAPGQDARQAWWVLGFDCGGHGTLQPGLVAIVQAVGLQHDTTDEHYWTLAEVRAEINALAAAIAAAGQEEGTEDATRTATRSGGVCAADGA